jgi:hypothetical protein
MSTRPAVSIEMSEARASADRVATTEAAAPPTSTAAASNNPRRLTSPPFPRVSSLRSDMTLSSVFCFGGACDKISIISVSLIELLCIFSIARNFANYRAICRDNLSQIFSFHGPTARLPRLAVLAFWSLPSLRAEGETTQWPFCAAQLASELSSLQCWGKGPRVSIAKTRLRDYLRLRRAGWTDRTTPRMLLTDRTTNWVLRWRRKQLSCDIFAPTLSTL